MPLTMGNLELHNQISTDLAEVEKKKASKSKSKEKHIFPSHLDEQTICSFPSNTRSITSKHSSHKGENDHGPSRRKPPLQKKSVKFIQRAPRKRSGGKKRAPQHTRKSSKPTDFKRREPKPKESIYNKPFYRKTSDSREKSTSDSRAGKSVSESREGESSESLKPRPRTAEYQNQARPSVAKKSSGPGAGLIPKSALPTIHEKKLKVQPLSYAMEFTSFPWIYLL